MIDVKNRVPGLGAAGRVNFQTGSQSMTGIMTMADNPSEEGTPWNAQTARLLQADIRTYTASGSISAGDVVDISGSYASASGTPSQGIALAAAYSGQSVDVIFSGIAYAAWVSDGQRVDSPGVQGRGIADGVLAVTPMDMFCGFVQGSYTGNSGDNRKINLGVTPKILILTSKSSGRPNSYDPTDDDWVNSGGLVFLARGGGAYSALKLTDTGFLVSYPTYYTGVASYETDPVVNANGFTYRFLAIY